MSFESSLQEGLLGESVIVRWLNKKGCHVLPAYEIEQSHGKHSQNTPTSCPLIMGSRLKL